MFHVHPNDLGGPFESLSDAMAAIQLGRTPPPTPPLPKGYHVTLKNGLFHIHPDELGGPFMGLADAVGAIQQKLHPFDNEKAGWEQMLRFINLLSEKDPDLTPATVSPQPEPREDPSEDRCSSADHLEYDPVTLEAIRIFERLEEEEEEIKNGMK